MRDTKFARYDRENNLFYWLDSQGSEAFCLLHRPQGNVFVCTELAQNTGRAITNDPVRLRLAISEIFEVPYDEIVQIEAYNQKSYDPNFRGLLSNRYSLVTVEGNIERQRHLSADEYHDLIGTSKCLRFYVFRELSSQLRGKQPAQPEYFSSLDEAVTTYKTSKAAVRDDEWDDHVFTALGVECKYPFVGAADIIHARNRKNYLITDFSRDGQFQRLPEFHEILNELHVKIGFDEMRDYRDEDGVVEVLPIGQWEKTMMMLLTRHKSAQK